MLGNPAYPTYQVFLAIFISAVIAGLIMPLWIRFLKRTASVSRSARTARSPTW